MPDKPPAPVDTYGIYIGFDQIKDQKKREYFLNMPTTFCLKKEEVDDLRRIGTENHSMIQGSFEAFKRTIGTLFNYTSLPHGRSHRASEGDGSKSMETSSLEGLEPDPHTFHARFLHPNEAAVVKMLSYRLCD